MLAAILVAASSVVPPLLADGRSSEHAIRFLATCYAAGHVFRALNRDEDAPRAAPPTVAEPAGKTLYITSFAFINACLACFSTLVERKRRAARPSASPPTSSAANVSFSSALFAVSSGVIMWNWVYTPQSLPRDYNRWLDSIAKLDPRLLVALRQAQDGRLYYGRDTGHSCHLDDMARELGLPPEWGDPRRTIPIKCELWHSGTGPSCAWNAVRRFAVTWQFAMRMYVPLNLVASVMRRRRPPDARALADALLSAARSSSFLGLFASSLVLTVCLARTHLGPRLLGRSPEAHLFLDARGAVASACALCGWSILLERPDRRHEMALFVAPRALRALLPDAYDPKVNLSFLRLPAPTFFLSLTIIQQLLWREQLAFVTSAAAILTAAHAYPESVHGLFGKMLRRINTPTVS